MKKIILIIMVLVISLAIFVFAQLPSNIEGAPSSSQSKDNNEGLAKATELMGKYLEYFQYYQSVMTGQIGSLIWTKGLTLIMKDADPNTKALVTFVQTAKQIKQMHGNVPSQGNKQLAAQKQKEIKEKA